MQTKCPIQGCGAAKRPDQLYCKAHWFSLPKTLQRKVWSTWRQVERRRRDAEAVMEYREAVREAETYILSHAPQPDLF